MNVTTVNITVDQAKKAFQNYRQAVQERHSEEDEAIMQAYKQIARGRPILNIIDAFKHAGVDHRYWPKLAIARADLKVVYCDVSIGGSLAFMPRQLYHWRDRGKSIHLPERTVPPRDYRTNSTIELRGTVPIIPPQLRPRGSLERYHILWEAEWEQVPRDPILLKRINKYLFAVLAQWDLTEVERMVLSGSRE